MSTVEQVSQFFLRTREEVCDTCLAAALGRPSRQVQWSALMLGKLERFDRNYRRCSSCGGLKWVTQRAAWAS